MKKNFRASLAAVLLLGVAVAGEQAIAQDSLLEQLPKSHLLVVSTVPQENGDLNPYGVAFVPHDFPENGTIHAGDILVSNFNDSANVQGTGTTIVSITRDGMQTLFFKGVNLGLTTALGVLRRGVVLVGNLPTANNGADIEQGSLIAIDRWGRQIAAFTDKTVLDGPWDLAFVDLDHIAVVFVSSVLNGTVSRLVFTVSEDGEHIHLESRTVIAEGYQFRPDPNALVVGPTGLAFDERRGALFVASTDDNAIYVVPNALWRNEPVVKGNLVYSDNAHLRGPLGLVLAPNGHLITSNGDAINADPNHPSELVEFTREGQFVAQFSIDAGEGGAFGIALHRHEGELRFAAVDDVTNALDIWTVSRQH